MKHGMGSCLETAIAIAIALFAWTVCCAAANAQSEPAPAAETRAMPQSIGGMPDPVRGEYYTSPLKTLGITMGFDSYVLSVATSVIYLAVVYPFQALFGSNKVEPVMLWLLLPIAGPWFAQYEDSVKTKVGWRVVLIADAGLQATGLVLGLIGAALSGWRAPKPEPTAKVSLRLGVAGGGWLGVTASIHTL